MFEIEPKPCAGLLCRMLCPYDFELDEEGCPLCQCRDPCRGIKCPGSETCQLEEVPCLKEPCPPVPTCNTSSPICKISKFYFSVVAYIHFQLHF